MLRLAELKVKIKSLAAEGRIIREDEKKYARKGERIRQAAQTPGLGQEEVRERYTQAGKAFDTYASLRMHRKAVVGIAARTALLAYLFLREKPYAVAERPNTKVAPDWEEVESTALRFGLNSYYAKTKDSQPNVELRQRFAAWRADAETYLKAGAEEEKRKQAERERLKQLAS